MEIAPDASLAELAPGLAGAAGNHQGKVGNVTD
jgi:hypothetical protein